MKINMGSPDEETRIEILPMIDVIFCILTFFILAAMGLTRQAGINVDLPRASSGTSQMREMMIVSLDPIGQLYVDRQPVNEQELIRELLTYQVSSPSGLIVLYASRSASYNEVVSVLDLMRSTGSDRVALATLPDRQGGSSLGGNESLDLDELLNQEFDDLNRLTPNGSSGAGEVPLIDPRDIDPLTPPRSPARSPSPGSPSGTKSP
ncbi:MAG: biopolymer transporter ExbD [Leptolyngbya sp. DLM2.Bin15]|nr:MAG: biopolymer transporter ExbD [Leptolyngbya sp. DLM2.Bin15]